MNNLTKLCGCLFAICCFLSAKAEVTATVMTQGTSLYNQTYFSSGSNGDLQTTDIKKYWDEDKYITSAGYTSNGWYITMSKGTGWTSQGYKTSSTWPDDYVRSRKADGFYITSLTASNSKWLVVTTKGTGYTNQQICSAPWSTLGDWIKKWWDKGYYITSIACKNNMWTMVMSIGSGVKYTQQSYFGASTYSELETKIKDKWSDGYRITALEYGDNAYFCVMSKYPGSGSDMQTYNINTDFGSWVKQKWDDNYKITYVGG